MADDVVTFCRTPVPRRVGSGPFYELVGFRQQDPTDQTDCPVIELVFGPTLSNPDPFTTGNAGGGVARNFVFWEGFDYKSGFLDLIFI